jgi:hypothetical protein
MMNPYVPPKREPAQAMQSSRSAAPRNLLVHAVAAILLYGVDALVFSQGVIAGIVTFVMVALGTIHGARRLIGGHRHFRHGLSIIVIYGVMMASVVVTIRVNNRLARRRADGIVAALKLYKSMTGDYPVRLTELVPDYMPAVPQAKYTLMFNEFTYHYDRTKHEGFLMYTALPPFGRQTYWLDTDTWGYLD